MQYQGSYDLRIVNRYEEELDFHPNTVSEGKDATLIAWKIGYSPLAVSVDGWVIQVRVFDGLSKPIPHGMVEGLIGA